MDYTVKDLIESKRFPEMKILTGKLELNKKIREIRIIEVPDMERFLRGEELLLTSLRVYQNKSEQSFRKELERLEQKKITGFILKRHPEIEEKIKYYDILLEFCQKHHIIVIEIPQNLYYWEIAKYIMMQIFDKETARLKYFKLTHDNFTSMLLLEKDIVCTTKNILYLLKTMIGNPVALYYSNFACFASTEGDMSDLVLSKHIKNHKPDVITKFKYLKQEADTGKTEYIVKMDILGRVTTYLKITEENEALTGLDYMALENAIITLQYSFIGTYAQNQIQKKYQRDIGYSMLNGLLSRSEMDEFAHMLKFNKKSFYCVTSFRVVDIHKGKKTKQDMNAEVIGIIETKLGKFLPEERIYKSVDMVVYIHETDEKESGFEFRRRMEEIQEVIQHAINRRRKNLDFQIGIGKKVVGYENLKKSFDDSKKALKNIDIIRIIAGDDKKSVVSYSKLGFFKMFETIKDEEEILQYIPESLKKLQEYDKEHHGELIDTLHIYLECNQSAKKAAERLFVHYRTIAYRLEKIKKLTGIDYDNSQEMLSIRNGIIISKIANRASE